MYIELYLSTSALSPHEQRGAEQPRWIPIYKHTNNNKNSTTWGVCVCVLEPLIETHVGASSCFRGNRVEGSS